MSHWTKSKAEIKDLPLLGMVARRKGLVVEEGENLELYSRYAGNTKARMLISDPATGDVAGVVQDENGKYVIQMDNYHNSLAQKFGENLSEVMRDYVVEVVQTQAMYMGGVLQGTEVQKDGSVEIVISV